MIIFNPFCLAKGAKTGGVSHRLMGLNVGVATTWERSQAGVCALCDVTKGKSEKCGNAKEEKGCSEGGLFRGFFKVLTVVALKSLLSIGLFHSPQNIMSQKHAEGLFFGFLPWMKKGWLMT